SAANSKPAARSGRDTRTCSTARAANSPEVSRLSVSASPIELSSSARLCANSSGLSHCVTAKARMKIAKTDNSTRMKNHMARSPGRRRPDLAKTSGEVDIDYIHQCGNGLRIIGQDRKSVV